jgi:hypothetical protein
VRRNAADIRRPWPLRTVSSAVRLLARIGWSTYHLLLPQACRLPGTVVSILLILHCYCALRDDLDSCDDLPVVQSRPLSGDGRISSAAVRAGHRLMTT